MSLPRLRRIAPLLLVFLLTAFPLAATTHDRQPREVRQSRLGIAGLLFEAWALVSRIWEKEGSSTDPFGNPKPNTAQPPSDNSGSPASGK